jgi:hypothetical protein
MNKTRFVTIIAGAVLIVAVILTLKAIGPMAVAKNNSQAYSSMGDLHRFESQQSFSGSQAPGFTRSYAGMGDLHRFEAQLSTSVSEALANSRKPGMGDLHRYEFLQSAQDR